MDLSLPDNKKLVSVFIFLVVVFSFYFFGVRTPVKKTMEEAPISSEDISSAYFVPPQTTSKEVKVKGRVIPVQTGEFDGATHKIVDGSGKVIIYAYTSDDKLKQQEQSVVNLVGQIPLGGEISPKTLLKVDYISFK